MGALFAWWDANVRESPVWAAVELHVRERDARYRAGGSV